MLGNRSIGSFDLFTQAVSKPKPAAPAMSQPFDDTNKTFDLEHPITFSTCSYTTELGLKILTVSTDIISSTTPERLDDFTAEFSISGEPLDNIAVLIPFAFKFLSIDDTSG